MFGFNVFVFAKDADLDPTCAADLATEEAASMNSGGHEAWASPPTGWYVGTSGTFSQPFKFTFSGAGDYLLCGYVQSDFSTSAAGQLRGVVTSPAPPAPSPPTPPAPPPAPARPAVVHAPRISRTRHALVCRPGTWSNTPSRVSYRWYERGRARSIASSATLRERHSLRGHRVRCGVTARNAAGAGTASTRWVSVR